MAAAPSSDSGRGNLRFCRGPRVARTTVASAPVRSAAQAVKPLTADSARASDRVDSPRARSAAIQARRSDWPAATTRARPSAPP